MVGKTTFLKPVVTLFLVFMIIFSVSSFAEDNITQEPDTVTCYLISSTLPEAQVSPGCSIYSNNTLPPNETVNYTIVVNMSDGDLSDTFSKDFEVQRPPVKPNSLCGGAPCGPNFDVWENFFPLEFTLNSSDPNGDPIIYESGSLPIGATLNPNTGLFSWVPDCTQGGQIYPVGFYAKNTTLSSPLYTVDITVVDWC